MTTATQTEQAKSTKATKSKITPEEALAFFQSLPEEDITAYRLEMRLRAAFTEITSIFAEFGYTEKQIGEAILLSNEGDYELNIPVEDEDKPSKRNRKSEATDEEKAEVKKEGERLKKLLIAHQKQTGCTQASIVKALSKGRGSVSTGTVRNWLKGEAVPRKKFHRRLRSFLGQPEPAKS
jgi:hypothetical protein